MQSFLPHQSVGPKCFLVEENSFTQVLGAKEFLIVILLKALDLDSQFLQKPDALFAVITRRFNRLRSAVSEQQPLSRLEFIALGVPAKIIVVVEDKNPG